jgi:hypothetical protein
MVKYEDLMYVVFQPKLPLKFFRFVLVDENDTCIELYTPSNNTKPNLKRTATK